MDEEPDPDRRALIGAIVAIPALGGFAHLALRIVRHHPEREAAHLPMRAVVDPLDERQLPIEEAWQAASDQKER